MDIFSAIILGIVEGITEFLPISSTAHLILTAKLLSIPETAILKSFEIAVQLGAILAVVTLYPTRLLRNKQVQTRIAVSTIPTVLLGAICYPLIKKFLSGSETSIMVILGALFTGGIILILFERRHRPQEGVIETMPLRTAFFIGLIQAIAFIPGVSRSGASMIGGMLLGLRRTEAIEYSFLLAVPIMTAATALDLYKSYGTFDSSALAPFVVGMLVAYIVAIIAIKSLLRFVSTHDLTPFGFYRIILALLFALLLL